MRPGAGPGTAAAIAVISAASSGSADAGVGPACAEGAAKISAETRGPRVTTRNVLTGVQAVALGPIS